MLRLAETSDGGFIFAWSGDAWVGVQKLSADTNDDAVVDAFDIEPFVLLFTGG